MPWTTEQVSRVVAALPERYAATAVVAAGCGLRQGEVFGLRVEDVDFLRRRLFVRQQVKQVGGKRLLAPPKGGKTREVPLPEVVALALAEHLRRFPPVDGLVFTSRERQPLDRNYMNALWKPALRAAGVEPSRKNGMHALRHYYASVQLEAGTSIRAVAEYLGHADPGFTLRVYTHLMPSSEDRHGSRSTTRSAPRVSRLCPPPRPEQRSPWSGRHLVRCRSTGGTRGGAGAGGSG